MCSSQRRQGTMQTANDLPRSMWVTVLGYTNICWSVVWDLCGQKSRNAIGSSRTLQAVKGLRSRTWADQELQRMTSQPYEVRENDYEVLTSQCRWNCHPSVWSCQLIFTDSTDQIVPVAQLRDASLTFRHYKPRSHSRDKGIHSCNQQREKSKTWYHITNGAKMSSRACGRSRVGGESGRTQGSTLTWDGGLSVSAPWMDTLFFEVYALRLSDTD